MKFLFSFFALFCSLAGFALNFHDVVYELPAEAASWTCQVIEQKRHEAFIYTPDEEILDDNFEFFSVSAHPLALELINPSTLCWMFKRLYPDMEVEFQVLNTYADSLLYHWYAHVHGEQKIQGWGRIFLTQSCVVQLNYVSEKSVYWHEAESVWLPILMAAENKSHFP